MAEISHIISELANAGREILSAMSALLNDTKQIRQNYLDIKTTTENVNIDISTLDDIGGR